MCDWYPLRAVCFREECVGNAALSEAASASTRRWRWWGHQLFFSQASEIRTVHWLRREMSMNEVEGTGSMTSILFALSSVSSGASHLPSPCQPSSTPPSPQAKEGINGRSPTVPLRSPQWPFSGPFCAPPPAPSHPSAPSHPAAPLHSPAGQVTGP